MDRRACRYTQIRQLPESYRCAARGLADLLSASFHMSSCEMMLTHWRHKIIRNPLAVCPNPVNPKEARDTQICRRRCRFSTRRPAFAPSALRCACQHRSCAHLARLCVEHSIPRKSPQLHFAAAVKPILAAKSGPPRLGASAEQNLAYPLGNASVQKCLILQCFGKLAKHL